MIQGGDEKAKGEVQIKDLIARRRARRDIKDRDEYLKKQAEAQFAVKEADLVEEVRKLLARHGLTSLWPCEAGSGLAEIDAALSPVSRGRAEATGAALHLNASNGDPMRILTVRHATTYRYARPVAFGQHRLMLRPRDSHDLRWSRRADAVAARQRALDARRVRQFGRAGRFPAAGRGALHRQHAEDRALRPRWPGFPIAPEAEFYPFVYSSSDRVDLGRLLEQHYPDPEGLLARWAEGFVTARPMRTLDLLPNMNAALKPHIVYAERHEQGTQAPPKRWRKAAPAATSPWCSSRRRAISASARASCPAISTIPRSTRHATQAVAATHAWAEVYLPGAGWIEYDPTDGLIAGENLIRVAVTRDPSQAIPISGSYTGQATDFLGMTVEVTVTCTARRWPSRRRARPRAGQGRAAARRVSACRARSWSCRCA